MVQTCSKTFLLTAPLTVQQEFSLTKSFDQFCNSSHGTFRRPALCSVSLPFPASSRDRRTYLQHLSTKKHDIMLHTNAARDFRCRNRFTARCAGARVLGVLENLGLFSSVRVILYSFCRYYIFYNIVVPGIQNVTQIEMFRLKDRVLCLFSKSTLCTKYDYYLCVFFNNNVNSTEIN